MRNLVLTTLALTIVSLPWGPRSGSAQRPPAPSVEQNAVEDLFRVRYGGEPMTLNPILADGAAAGRIHSYVIETLLGKDESNYEWRPRLASTWTANTDTNQFEFKIRDNAVWSDGEPVTAEDVKFSFDIIFDERYPTAQLRPYFETIERVEIVGPKTVRFTARNSYFGNFIACATLGILPKHIYGDPETATTLRNLHDSVIGSGPYTIERWNHGRNIILKKNSKWWGESDAHYSQQFKFKRIAFQFIGDDNVALEMLKKNQLDFVDLSPEMYTQIGLETSASSPYKLQKVTNRLPTFVNAIGFNLKNPLFQDRKVRLGLAHLMDRDSMIARLFRGLSAKATGPWYPQSEFADPTVEPIPFDPAKAVELFKGAGWVDDGESPWLQKVVNGIKIPFRFTILTSSPKAVRHLTYIKEDAAKAGVDIQIRLLGMSAFSKLLDERKFEAVDLGWGGGPIEFDPRSGWHSESTGEGGLNFVGYANPEADRLIDEIRNTYDREDRLPLMRRLYRIIAEDVPMIFLLNETASYYAYSNRVERKQDYFDYDSGVNYMQLSKTVSQRGAVR